MFLDSSDRVVMGLDSSESPIHREQEGSSYNGHIESVNVNAKSWIGAATRLKISSRAKSEQPNMRRHTSGKPPIWNCRR
jgi:hypothetical protein